MKRKPVLVSVLACLIGIVILVPLVRHHFITIGACPPGSSGSMPGCGPHLQTEYLSMSCQITGTGGWLDSNAGYHLAVGGCGVIPQFRKPPYSLTAAYQATNESQQPRPPNGNYRYSAKQNSKVAIVVGLVQSGLASHAEIFSHHPDPRSRAGNETGLATCEISIRRQLRED